MTNFLKSSILRYVAVVVLLSVSYLFLHILLVMPADDAKKHAQQEKISWQIQEEDLATKLQLKQKKKLVSVDKEVQNVSRANASLGLTSTPLNDGYKITAEGSYKDLYQALVTLEKSIPQAVWSDFVISQRDDLKTTKLSVNVKVADDKKEN